MPEEQQEERSEALEPASDQPLAAAEEVDADSTGDPDLDRRLSKPPLEGLQGIDTAQVWISAFLIAVVGLIVYSNAFSLPFHYLDRIVIRDNAAAQSILTVPQALDAKPSALVPMLTYAVTWALTGDASLPFHAVNIVLHVLNGVLVYLLCRRLLPESVPQPVPMLAGLFLVLHPLATESVNYIVGRSVLLAAAFTLLSLLLYLRAVRPAQGIGYVFIGFSLLSMALAWNCSWVGALIPALILSVDWVVNGSALFQRRTVHASYWGLLVLLVVAFVAGRADLPNFERLVSTAPQTTNGERATAFMVGLEATASPIALTVDHNLPPKTTRGKDDGPSGGVGLVVFNGAVLGVFALALLALRSPAGLALLWFGTTLAWTAYSFTLAEPFSERGLYVPLCGIVLIVPWLVMKVSVKRLPQVAAGIAAAVLLIAAGSGTYLRNRVWQDELSLWQDAAAKTPASPLPQQRIGALLFDQGFGALQQAAALAREQQGPAAAGQQELARQTLTTAEEYLRDAVDKDATHAPTVNRLGRTLAFLGRSEEAIDRIVDSLRLDPMNFDYTVQLATALEGRASASGSMNDRLRAIDYYRRAERLGELPPEIRTELARLLAFIGALDEAERELTTVLASAEYAPASEQLLQVRSTKKVVSNLETRSKTLLEQDPQSREGLRLHAEALVGRGKILQATYVLDRFLIKFPDDAQGWILMGIARAFVNDEQDFLREWPAAPAAPAGEPSLWIQLARRCALSGRWNAARTYLESATGKTPEVSLPLVTLGEIALDINAQSVAIQYLEEATRQYVNSPRPWLLLCDIAVASDNLPIARRYLAEAEKRGAYPDEIAERHQRVGQGPAPGEEDAFKSILR